MSLDQIIKNKDSRPNVEYPSLPVSEKVDEIKQLILDNQVVIVAGETGSGKSTQLPKICLDLGLGDRGFIGHTQPRRLAARSVAMRIAEELKSEIGTYVGYKIRFNDHTSDQTYIKVMTDGILLNELQSDRLLKKYSVIIIDEAHERSLNIDFILGYLKFILAKRPDLKVIITSATIDHERFSNFYHNAPIIEVSGRTYPVEIRYHEEWQESEVSEKSQPERILDAVDELTSEGLGDILVFFATEREIHEALDFLKKANLKNTDVLALYARLSNQQQQQIFNPHHRRRIILSTNVAETSVTVPGIRYVIDTGKVRISRYSYRTKVQRLPIEPISQASANQRAGRCGRVASGICIRLYSKEDFLSRDEFTEPEILRTNLASVILQMTVLRLGQIDRFPFIEAPDMRFIKDGFRLLHELNAMNDKKQITPTGKLMSRLPVDPRFARMLIEAKQKGVLAELLIIVSFLSVQDPRERPREFQEASHQKHLQDKDKQSDFIGILNLYARITENMEKLSNNQFKRYCRNEFLSYLRIKQWREVYFQLLNIVKQFKWPINQSDSSESMIHQAIVSGLLSHIGFNYEDKEYLGARGIKFHIFPGSFVFKQTPKWIVASELVETTRLFGRVISQINPQWLESLARHLVKKHYSEPHWSLKRQDVIAYERVSLYGLDIVQKRLVSYGKINLDESREIFIREALVADQLKTNAHFYQYNLNLLDSVEDLENKARRRDILIDDETLYQYYDKLIPVDIYNKVTFESWYKKLDKQGQKSLYFKFEDLTRLDTSEINKTLYPSSFKINGLKLSLDYHFDPTSQIDGVTMIVPVELIERIDIEKTDWLVPGLLEAKISGLMKALPKKIRKNVMPIPQYAKAVYERISYDLDKNLRDSLVKELVAMTGTLFDQSVWDEAELEPYLMMNYRVIDQRGKILKEGRNLRPLQQEFLHKNEVLKSKVKSKTNQNKAYQQWEFDALKEKEFIKKAHAEIEVYPCLVDLGEKGVQLSNENTLEKAKKSHFLGIKRLLGIQCRHLFKVVKNNIKNKQKLSLCFTPLVKSETQWLEDLFQASLIDAFNLSYDIAWQIRTHKDFETLLKQGKGSIVESAEEISNKLSKIMPIFYDINKKLNAKSISLDLVESYQDLKSQLDAMFYSGFISKTEKKWFDRLEIYLLSMIERLKKLPINIKKDRQFMLEVNQVYEKLDRVVEQKNLSDDDFRVVEIEWLIQELWISFYAQQYKTIEPVSSKRLIKKISII
ncbi:ATP-dependent RNA helicase HrpA [Thiotrichales bacterium 19S11-10]|nr:ATP-dependent RNA helicase HrpA [Thiotrichales bacterium 19S11-10]